MMGQSRTRLLGVTVLVAVFAAGGLTGAVVQRTALADDTQPRAQQKRAPSLFEKLQLTQEQQTQVCAFLKSSKAQMAPHEQATVKVWKEHEPAMRAIYESTRVQIDSVLTPEQRSIAAQFRAERQKFMEARKLQERSQKQSDGKEPRRGTRPGDSNPLGVTCPGLNDGPRGGPPHGGPGWGGDSSRDKRDSAGPAKTLTVPTPKAEEQA